MNSYKRIAVIGGTGKAGKSLVRQLVKKGFSVRALLRDPNKMEVSSHLVEKVVGDAANYESVFSLLQGCDAVISTLGQSKGENPIFSISTSNIIKAMNSLSIKRYIVITGLTIDTPFDKKSFRTKLMSKIMKLSFPAIIADKQKEYYIISESNLDWTIVRLPLIDQAESAGTIKTSLYDCPGKRISSTDLAYFLANQLSDETFYRKSPFIAS